ncbi:probable disease resistance protein At5g66900 isoform X2 [Carya illinoinensis]|uniref:probable disease resistance protein At5g66900 isoform X2 n=1 Tax=Carya illinoinensis TaxID=32201 RepID=UPI001C729586|nr:probable disease resistance protein At5g66900 isoform X2 [Carya illinoinensis]
MRSNSETSSQAMASVAVANAALGAAFERVFSILYEAITDVINKTRMYESILLHLKGTLDQMRPLVEKMVLSNRERDLSEERTNRLIKRMEKAEKRVRKYSQLPWWKYLVRFHYAKKLVQLEKDLSGFFQVELPAWNAMNVLDVLESVRGPEDISQRLSLTRLNSVASCVVPRLRDFVIGLDVPLKELKMQLLAEEVSLLVLTAPGGCGKTTLVKMLGHDDDIKAGLQDGSSSYIPDGEMVKKIVKGCGGFPLALKVVGKSLCGKPAVAWLVRVAKWSDGCSILDTDIESELLENLQSSLDFKGPEMILGECFMDLGSFPEDQRIPVATLIDMWSELYEPVVDGIHAIANLHEINNLNLVSLVATRQDVSEVGSYCSEDFVLQHDLLRELAIHQCRKEPFEQRKRLIIDISGNINIPKWWTEEREQPIDAQLLSISTGEKFSSRWCNILPTKVEVLVLNFQTKNYGLPEFLEKMDKLKVLIVTNYGFFPAELGNVQLLGFLPNLKRIRLQKVSIPSIFKNPPPLRNLEKISLFMCNGQNFRNCSIEISNSWSNLMEINIDYCNDLLEFPTCLCYVVSLKKVSITNCHKLFALPIEIRKLTSLEVLRLRSCTNLSELPESITSLQNLRILDISDCLSIGKLPKHIGELLNLNEIHMTGCLRLRNPLPPSTMNLEKLELVICDKERAKLWEPIREYFRMALSLHMDIRIAEKDINLNWLTNRL